MSEKTGAEMIAAERQRQIDGETYSLEHDDQHVRNQLAWAATCYASPETVYRRWDHRNGTTYAEPWPEAYVANAGRGAPGFMPWRRPECDRITELVKAGALIAAEIDRLQRGDDE